MCDYSLQHVASHPAKVGEKLVTSGFFATSSKGFRNVEKFEEAVCLLPGTEIAFAQPVTFRSHAYTWLGFETRPEQVAIFRQINTDNPFTHHDCLEFADGERVMLNDIEPNIEAVVLQLPAAPKTADEAKAQERVAIAG